MPMKETRSKHLPVILICATVLVLMVACGGGSQDNTVPREPDRASSREGVESTPEPTSQVRWSIVEENSCGEISTVPVNSTTKEGNVTPRRTRTYEENMAAVRKYEPDVARAQYAPSTMPCFGASLMSSASA